MKSSKKTINVLVLIFVALVSYFFNIKEKGTPSSQKADETKAVQIVQKESQSHAGSADYDTIMVRDKLGQNANAPVHYYMLALSWSPAFCDSQRRQNDGQISQHLQYQCAGKQEFGWVIHGLWPQNKNARSVEQQPRFCQGDLAPLSPQLIEKYLPESPGMSLLQGQWEKHGACAFNNAEEYFAKQKALFQDLVLPKVDMRKNELFRWMRKHNPQLERVYLGASKNELYICYDKLWQPIDCPR